MEPERDPRTRGRQIPSGLNFRGYLDALDADELTELARQMAELEQHPGWVALTELLKDARGKVHETLEIGPTFPQEEYARAMGMAGVTRQIVLLPSHVVQAAEKKQKAAERSARPEQGETE